MNRNALPLPPQWPHREHSTFVQAAGYRFHVQHLPCHSSRSDQAPYLLLHGTGASSHSWAGLMPLLAEHRAVVAIDLPGHAFTLSPSQADLSIPGVARSIRSLLDEMQIEPGVGIGHSAGAAILAEMSLSRQLALEKLVSINGALLPLNGVAGIVFSPLAKVGASMGWLPGLFARRASDRRQVLRLINSTGSSLDEPGLQCYETLLSNPIHVAGVLKMMAHWQLERLMPRLSSLDVQTDLFAADADRTLPLRDAYRLHALLPNARLHVIKNLGHLAHEENPAHIMACMQTMNTPESHAHEDNRIRA